MRSCCFTIAAQHQRRPRFVSDLVILLAYGYTSSVLTLPECRRDSDHWYGVDSNVLIFERIPKKSVG